MPVECYRVVESDELSDGTVLAETTTRAPRNTNLADLLRIVAPSTEQVGHPPQLGGARTFADVNAESWRAYFRIERGERDDALALLESHRRPVVTTMNIGCDIAVCLDFYAHPLPDTGDQPDWEHTAIGELVYEAKYRHRREAADECRHLVRSYIEAHPILRQVTGVAAIPGSKGVTSRLLSQTARAIAQAFDVPVVKLQRVRKATPRKTSWTRPTPTRTSGAP